MKVGHNNRANKGNHKKKKKMGAGNNTKAQEIQDMNTGNKQNMTNYKQNDNYKENIQKNLQIPRISM